MSKLVKDWIVGDEVSVSDSDFNFIKNGVIRSIDRNNRGYHKCKWIFDVEFQDGFYNIARGYQSRRYAKMFNSHGKPFVVVNNTKENTTSE